MELNFDKEMDALLRRARGGTAAAVGDHIDADAISAFAENALPDAMRRVYMSHLADCDRCRKQLSFSIANQETAAFAAAPQAAEVATAATESLWSRFFRAPNLAMAMGAVVLMFGSLLGYLAIQNQSSPNSVASANKTESRADGTATQPFEAPNAAAPASNVPQVSASPAMTESAPATSAPGSSTLAKGGETAPATVPGDTGTTDTIIGGVPAGQPKPAAPAPPVASGTVAAEREVTTSKDEDKSLAGTKADDYTRDGTPRSPKKVAEGPTRGNVSIQQQIENNAQGYEIPMRKRSAGGRTFEDRNGVWTDTAYNGQAVTIYKRGSEPYKKLDSSIRSIADQLGGTVIIVAGSRAYKIQ